MTHATGALTPVASPDRLDVAVTRSMAQEVLRRPSLPLGPPLVCKIADFQGKIGILVRGLNAVSAEPECHQFRAATGKIVNEAQILLLQRPKSLGGSQYLLSNLARMIVRLCGAYDLLGGGDSCPPTR